MKLVNNRFFTKTRVKRKMVQKKKKEKEPQNAGLGLGSLLPMAFTSCTNEVIMPAANVHNNVINITL
jgi:hypothetical protein